MSRARAVPTIGRAEAAGLARVEYRRLVDLLRGLDDEQWTAPTDCPEWSVPRPRHDAAATTSGSSTPIPARLAQTATVRDHEP